MVRYGMSLRGYFMGRNKISKENIMKDEKNIRREEILEMVAEIDQKQFIDMIYGFVRRLHREEKSEA